MKKLLAGFCFIFLALTGVFSLPVSEAEAYTFGVVSCRTSNPSTNDGGWGTFNPSNMNLIQRSASTGCPNNTFPATLDNGMRTVVQKGGGQVANSNYGTYAGHSFTLGDPVATGKEISSANLHFGNRSQQRRPEFGSLRYEFLSYGIGFGTAQSSYFNQTIGGATQASPAGHVGPNCANVVAAWHPTDYCYVATYGPTPYNSSQMGSGGQQYAIGFFLQCQSPYVSSPSCYEGVPTEIDYSARVNVYNIEVRVQDNQPPVLFNGGGGLWTGDYLQGNQALYFASNDNSGVRRIAASVTSIGGGANYANFQPQPDLANCAVSNAAADQYLSITPCPNKDLYSEWNTASVADGVYQVNLSAVDPSNYPAGISRTVTIDNSPPGPNNAGQANPSNNCNSAYIYPPPGTANGWIKDTITVGGQACDSTSGIASSTIQSSVNGGSYENLPSCNQTANPGAIAQLSCGFDSTKYSEGSTVSFRVVATNRAGATTTSNNSSTRRIDNNPPSVSGLAFFHNDGAFTPLNRAPDNKRWTNRPETLGRWDQVSAGSGSPITEVYTQYTSGPSSPCSTPQARVTHSPSTTTRVLPNNPTQTCQQGKHDLRVWALDEAGNTSSSSPPAAFGSYYYDTVAPAAPTGGGADPSGWTNVNDFKVFWKNSGYNNTTQAPFRWHPYRINNQSPKQTWVNCLGSNQDCERTGVTVPEATGVYPYKTWHRDWADNENEENSITISLYYRRGGEACIVE